MSAEKVYKNFSSFITQCANTFVSLVKILLRSKPFIKLPKATEESCIILGNGPSLNQSLQKYPDFFKKHPLVCVNSFSLTTLYTELKPGYYVILDPSFWLGNNDVIHLTMDHIRNKTTWKVYLLIPVQAAKLTAIQQLQQNNNIHIIPFNYTVFKGFKNIGHLFYKKNLAMMQSQNVLVASLFLAVNIGFKNVYVFGADHTWHEHLHVNDNNVLCFKDVHFYENEEKISYKPFYKGVHNQVPFRMDEIMATWAKTFYGYISLNEYAVSQSCTIYNASEVSFIDAFKRVKL